MLKKLRNYSWLVLLLGVGIVFFSLDVLPVIKADARVQELLPQNSQSFDLIHRSKELKLKGSARNKDGKLYIDVKNSGKGSFYLDLEVIVSMEDVNKTFTRDQIESISFGDSIAVSANGNTWIQLNEAIAGKKKFDYIKIEQQYLIEGKESIPTIVIDVNQIKDILGSDDVEVVGNISDSIAFEGIVPVRTRESELFKVTPKK